METMQNDNAGQESALTGIVKWLQPRERAMVLSRRMPAGTIFFVHISAVQRAGLRKLNEGEHVRFALQQREGRVAAVAIERLH